MVRTVKVNLEADAAGYIAPVEESAKATEGLDRKVEALDRDLNKVPADAAKAAAAMKLLGDESGKAGVKLDEMGKQSTSLRQIDERITATREEVRKLAEEFNRTGDVSVLQRLFGKQSELKDLENLGKRLIESVGQDGKLAGQEFTKNFSSSLQGVEATPYIGPIVVGGIIAAIVAASPAIGAALNGAALAGLGLGGIGLGIVGQLHDPRIRAEFAALGHDLSQGLSNATESFKQPLLQAGQILGGAFDAIGPHLAKDLSGLAQYVKPLADGLQRMFINIQPGLDKAFAAAGPLLKEFAEQLPALGSAISRFFSDLSGHEQGAKEGLRTIFVIVEQLVIGLGKVIGFLSAVYQDFVGVADVVTGFFAKILGWVPVVGGYLQRIHDIWHSIRDGAVGAGEGPVTELKALGGAAMLTADDFAKLTTEINATKDTADTVAAAMAGKIFNEMMSIDQATLAWHQSLTQLGDTLKQNTVSARNHAVQLDINTAAGQANRSAILGAVTANMQLYQAQIAAGMKATDAAAAYDSNTEALRKQLHAAHLTEDQINSLIGKYAAVPDEVNTQIALHGIEAAIDRLTNLIGLINDIPGYRQVTIDERHLITTDMGHVQRWGGIYQHAATGLLRDAKVYSSANPGRYMIAEPATGGEAFVPRFGDYARSTSILDQAARWYGGRFAPAGGGGVVVNVTVPVNAGLVADQAQLANLVGEQVVKSIKSGGAVRYAISAVAAGQGF